MADSHVHTLTVRNHRISCGSPVLVQHGMGHDAIALDLDAEWDGLAARIVLGPCADAYDVLYEGGPVVVPAATLAEAGWLPVSVVGYGSDGTVRVTTERCDHLLRVVESGCVDGSVPPEDQPDLLGQLVEAAESAESAADAATKAAAEATGAAASATEAAGKVDAAVESATKAAQSATDAAASATDAAKSATDAAERADRLAEDIPAYVTAAEQAATEAARAASEADGAASAADKSASAAAGSATEAAGSATQAAQSAQQVADKYITGAAATTLAPEQEATAQVVNKVLQLGIPQGEKGDKGDPGETPDTSGFLKLTHPNKTGTRWEIARSDGTAKIYAETSSSGSTMGIKDEATNDVIYMKCASGQAYLHINGKLATGFVDSFTASTRGDLLPTVLCLRNTLMDYPTTTDLTQAVSAESSARSKADELLQADVDGKMAPDDIVAGENVSVSVGDDGKVTISAEPGLAVAMAGAGSSALSAYPVGSIYLSVSSTSPSTLFGGKWERIQDRFLLCAGSTYAAGSTGGEATHKLTVDEMPSHTHALYEGSGGSTSSAVKESGNIATQTQPAGGSKPHNNMPPYIAVYVWKRTA